MMKIVAIALLFIVSCAASPFTEANCAAFCNTVDTVCNTTAGNGGTLNVGMFSVAGCNAFCAIFVGASLGGDTTDTNVNTLGCRSYWATMISSNASLAATKCPAISITGGGICGTTAADRCTSYCTLNIANCPDTWTVPGIVNAPNSTVCGLACAGVQGSGGYPQNGPEFNTYDTSGDTVQCRSYHSLAAALLGYPHCAHAAPLGGGVCGAAKVIPNFCNTLNLICGTYATISTGTNYFPYSTVAHCISDAYNYSQAILGYQWGPVNATTGDSIGCREYHGGFPSLLLPGTHCAHAGWASTQCGTRSPTSAPTPAPTMTMTTSSASTISAVFVAVVSILSFLL